MPRGINLADAPSAEEIFAELSELCLAVARADSLFDDDELMAAFWRASKVVDRVTLARGTA
jgi:hypothetical protein